jgi:adenosylcobinamide-phosphate synthase
VLLFLELSVLAFVLGVLLDFILGDPRWMKHPVVIIGGLISGLEKVLRNRFSKTPEGERKAGFCLVVLVLLITGVVCAGVLALAFWIHPLLYLAVETLWCWQIPAAKSLKQESMKVFYELKKQDLEGARKAVSMIVGRDTQNLTSEQVAKAAVETVAENTSDGIVAPMFYTMLLGAWGGMMYKAVNTMDSMIGYRNDRYLNFGRYGAKLDDICNYIPARLSAWLMIGAAFLLGMDGKDAKRIYLRDRYNHDSPNSAHTESVCAGALNVQLAGDAYYFGKLHPKKTIGDKIRGVEAEDIPRANRLMYGTTLLTAGLVILIRLVVIGGVIWFK